MNSKQEQLTSENICIINIIQIIVFYLLQAVPVFGSQFKTSTKGLNNADIVKIQYNNNYYYCYYY